jgi:hypothetical protein
MPPYYGHMAAATALGQASQHDNQVAELPLHSECDSAYAMYEDGQLVRVAVLNLHEYNTTSGDERLTRDHLFSLGDAEHHGGAGGSDPYHHKRATIQQLLAQGAERGACLGCSGILQALILSMSMASKIEAIPIVLSVRVGEVRQGSYFL